MDLQGGLLEVAGGSYQMVHKGEWIDEKPVDPAHDVTISAGHELMVAATSKPRPDRDTIMIGAVSGCQEFAQKFTDNGLLHTPQSTPMVERFP